MATSGTATFNLDVVDVIEEAFERCGLEARSGNDYRTARRSLNLLSNEWANRGLNLWTVDSGTIALVAGQATYTLPADTLDLIEHSVRYVSGGVTTDQTLSRVSVSDYAGTTNKATPGRPTQIFIQRTDPPRATLWPVPQSADTLVYYRLRRMQDVSDATQTVDVPSRFLPALIAGLAYQVAMKRPEAMGRVQMLQAEYERQFMLAADEDRDRASFWITPYVR